MNSHAKTHYPLDASCIGVAGSGGGIRAALLTAGALVAVNEHAAEHNKSVVLSTVSGSSLLALELAWSRANTDDVALQEAIGRIARFGYWPRKRFWVIILLPTILIAIAFALWNYSEYSAPATAICASFSAAAALVVVAALFRNQGIWYRGAGKHRGVPGSLYSASPGDFVDDTKRRLRLDTIVFTATSLSTGQAVYFEGRDLPPKSAVRKFAEASAAFPGAVMASRLPGRGEELFADGGISDNTGLYYFEQLTTLPSHVIAVDAGVAAIPPSRQPYVKLNLVLNWLLKPLLIGLLMALTGSIAGLLIGEEWIATTLMVMFICVVLALGLAIPVLFLEGAVTDIRWLGRGWPITLRTASDLRLRVAESRLSESGGRLSVITMPDAIEAKTQLSRLPAKLAAEIVSGSYNATCSALGQLPRPTTLEFFSRLNARL